MGRRIGRWCARLLLGLMIVEGLLWLAMGNLDVAPYELHPADGRCVGLAAGEQSTYTGTILRIPAVVHAVNEHGYRGPARAAQRVDGSGPRLVTLGDSFTFGMGVGDAQALPAALERELRQQGHERTEVLNFGVPGYNLRESVDQYRHFARQWQPDIVVLFLFENDLDPPMCDVVRRGPFMWAVRHSRLFRAGVVLLAPGMLAAPFAQSTPERTASLRRDLTELKQRVSDDGATLYLVSLADPLSDAAQTRSLAAELGVRALVFERHEYRSFGIIPRESHWTAEGNARAAARIGAWLQLHSALDAVVYASE